MSFTHVGKNGRVYVRAFDHAEARSRYQAGESMAALAAEYGVSASTVYLAAYPGAKERNYARRRKREQSGTCPDCGAHATVNTAGQHRCRSCAGKRAATSVRADALLCFTCKEWKPDEEFPRNRAQRGRARRGRAGSCRRCGTVLRQRYRERHKLPCAGCGKPALPASEKGLRGTLEPRCRACMHEHQRTPEYREAARQRELARNGGIQGGAEARRSSRIEKARRGA